MVEGDLMTVSVDGYGFKLSQLGGMPDQMLRSDLLEESDSRSDPEADESLTATSLK